MNLSAITLDLIVFVLVVSFVASFSWVFGHALATWIMRHITLPKRK